MKELPIHLDGMTVQHRINHEAEALKILTADTLSLLMEDLGISQRELARRLEQSEANISKLLSGSSNLKLSTIAAIATALGVRVQPHLTPAPRQGTPAEHDPALPDGVFGISPDDEEVSERKPRILAGLTVQASSDTGETYWNRLRLESHVREGATGE